MIVFEFTNGQVRFDYKSTRTEQEKIICFGFIGVDYIKRHASTNEIKQNIKESIEVQNEYDYINNYNNSISAGNRRLAQSTNHNQFMNAYL